MGAHHAEVPGQTRDEGDDGAKKIQAAQGRADDAADVATLGAAATVGVEDALVDLAQVAVAHQPGRKPCGQAGDSKHVQQDAAARAGPAENAQDSTGNPHAQHEAAAVRLHVAAAPSAATAL